jgi:hypothetical protein
VALKPSKRMSNTLNLISMRLYFFFLMLFFGATNLGGQTASEVLDRYFTSLQHDTVWTGIVTTKVYSGASRNPEHTIEMQVKRFGDFFVYESDFFRVLKNEQYLISIDKISKVVSVGSASLQSDKINLFSFEQLRNQLSSLASGTPLSEKGSNICFKVENPSEYFSACEYCFDRKTSYMVSTTSWYVIDESDPTDEENYVISIFQRKPELQNRLQKSDFSESSVIRVFNGKATLMPLYQGFVINYLR